MKRESKWTDERMRKAHELSKRGFPCRLAARMALRDIDVIVTEPSPAEQQRMGINTYGGASISPDTNW
jgi:hypothetical protein